MNIYLFGKTSLAGEVFYQSFNSEELKIHSFSRYDINSNKLNLKEPSSFSPINNQKFKIISFAPIWDLSNFLNYLLDNDQNKLINLDEIIACSSTSTLTKRYEANNFDKNLSSTLMKAEKKIIGIAKHLNINCQIIRPTMIYGSINGVEDKNISKILLIMRSLKFLVLPSISGMRQPIHAIQLANVIFSLIYKPMHNENKKSCQIINVGGDQILDYAQMINNLKDSLSMTDKAKKCLVLKIPNRLYLISILPVMFFSPKTFAALYRVCSDLAGFKKASEITNTHPKKFPFTKD